MKPAWDQLADEYDGSPKVLIADVDCTGSGEALCSKYGVQGYPSIKAYRPPGEEFEDYEGGRDFDALKEFAETLGPGCSPNERDNCSEDQLAEMDALLEIPEEERAEELGRLEEELREKKAGHEQVLQSLNFLYTSSSKALEELEATHKPRIKKLKMVEPRESDDDDEDDDDEDDDEDDESEEDAEDEDDEDDEEEDGSEEL